MPGRFRSHGALQGELGDPRREVSEEAVLPGLRRAVDRVVTLAELFEQLRDLLGGVLQVVVHRHDDVVACGADAAQQCIVLAEVAHQVDAADPVVPGGELLDHPPAAVAAPVVDEDELIGRSGLLEHGPEPGHQLGRRGLAVVDRNDDRQGRGTKRAIRLLRVFHTGALTENHSGHPARRQVRAGPNCAINIPR